MENAIRYVLGGIFYFLIAVVLPIWVIVQIVKWAW